MDLDTSPDRILIVVDEKDVAGFLKSAARSLGYCSRISSSFESFCDEQREFDPTVVLLDLEMPGNGGKDYLKFLAQQESRARVVLIGGRNQRTTTTSASVGSVLGLDMAAVIRKPAAIHSVRQELRKHLQASRPITVEQLAVAIRSGQIRPHFQPKLSRDQSGAWITREVEALARWHQADGSVVMPDNFIGLAEDNGMIRELTISLIDQVVQQLSRWTRQGNRLRAAVNLSPALLTDRELPAQIEVLLQKYNVENRQLVLEMTEQALVGYEPAVIDVLHRFRARQFGLVIDNFGTGGAALELLYRLPIDEIKVDRSFIQRSSIDQDIWRLIEANILLGQKLGKTVCAEGVETHDTFNRLSRIGCDKQQGFLIGKPVPGNDLSIMHKLAS